LSVESILVRAT